MAQMGFSSFMLELGWMDWWDGWVIGSYPSDYYDYYTSCSAKIGPNS